MWISKKKFQELEKRIADLEKIVQDQQQLISSQRPNVHPELLLRQAVHDAQSNAHNLTFRANLSNRTLFEQKIE